MQRKNKRRAKSYLRGRVRNSGRSFSKGRLVLAAILFIMGAACLCMMVNYWNASANRHRENEQLAQLYAESFVQEEAAAEASSGEAHPEETSGKIPETLRSLSGDVPDKAAELYRQNNDLAGWLYIRGVVSLPVVYRDNTYYLNHSFSGEKNSGGTLFLDQSHPLTEETQNLVIHGHNMHDSSMFGIVSRYDRLSQVKSSPFAQFSTLYAPEDYVLFAVLEVNPDVSNRDYFAYIGRPRFDGEEDFFSYTEDLKRRSLFEIPIDVQPSDGLLTLATCSGDERLVAVFRRIREGEDREHLRELIGRSFAKMGR